MNTKQLLGFASLVLVSLTTQAGVYIEMTSRDATTGKEEGVQKMWVQNGMARFESSGARSSMVIFKNDTLYAIDDATKTYHAIDKATLDQALGAMDDAMAKMRAQMEKMPPEQRAMMEQMMKQRGGAMPGMNAPSKPIAIDAKPAGGSDTVAGKSCKLWNVSRDGELSQQLCVAASGELPGADEVIAFGKKMTSLFEKFGSRMGDMFSSGMQQSNSALAQINGYPIRSRAYHDGKLATDESVLKTWTQQSIDAAKFDVPAGYTKQEMPRMGKP